MKSRGSVGEWLEAEPLPKWGGDLRSYLEISVGIDCSLTDSTSWASCGAHAYGNWHASSYSKVAGACLDSDKDRPAYYTKIKMSRVSRNTDTRLRRVRQPIRRQ